MRVTARPFVDGLFFIPVRVDKGNSPQRYE